MHLLSSKLYCFLLVGECSSLCVATVYVPLFIVSKKKTSLFLIIYSQCASLINNNKNLKKIQTPQDVYNKDADQTVPPHNLMPVFIQPGMFTHFDTRILDYKTSHLLSLIIFGRPTKW